MKLDTNFDTKNYYVRNRAVGNKREYCLSSGWAYGDFHCVFLKPKAFNSQLLQELQIEKLRFN